MGGAAVISADTKPSYTPVLSLLLATASWIPLFWTTPAAFACAVTFGLGAVLLGISAFRYAALEGAGFGPIFRSLTGAASGAVTSMLALTIWTLVWPGIAARQSQQERAHSLLSSMNRQTTGAVPAAPPHFSQPGGTYSDSVLVSISAGSADSIVCYTTDGSEPSPQSDVYIAPIALNQSATIKAKTFRPGFQPSGTVAESYTLTDRDLGTFNSNLPLVIINTGGRSI